MQSCPVLNGVGEKPGYVVFGSAGIKDSLKNIEENGEFVCSMATWDLRYHMNMTAAAVPYGVDEFPLAGLTGIASKMVKPPRVEPLLLLHLHKFQLWRVRQIDRDIEVGFHRIGQSLDMEGDVDHLVRQDLPDLGD